MTTKYHKTFGNVELISETETNFNVIRLSDNKEFSLIKKFVTLYDDALAAAENREYKTLDLSGDDLKSDEEILRDIRNNNGGYTPNEITSMNIKKSLR